MLTEVKSQDTVKKEKEFTILYVDDEFANLRLFEMAFKRHYNVFLAESGQEAIEVLRNESIQLLVTDQKMPRMTGTELLENTIPEFPDLIRIILTGYADIEAIIRAVNKCKIHKYVTKPYDHSDMKLTLDKALELFKITMEKRGLVEELAQINRSLEQKVKERTTDLEAANQRLMDGLIFAQTIQESILPKEKDLADGFQDAFIIYEPKDFVGGDFFWQRRVNVAGRDLKIIAVVDCMGHGVAGALLSMIGESQLNLITDEIDDLHADSILEKLDTGLRKILTRSGSEQNGATMDVTMAIVDKANQQLQFSGAKLDLILFRNGELERVKGTRKSIGSDWNENISFKRHHISLNGVTEFYMYSDGFQDQYNYENTKKFGSKNLLELLKNVNMYDLNQQKLIISQTLNDWKRDTEQVDDITLIGICI